MNESEQKKIDISGRSSIQQQCRREKQKQRQRSQSAESGKNENAYFG